MKKSLFVFLSIFSLSSCINSYYIPTDNLGNPSTDKFASTYSDTVSIKENGTVKVINNNTIKACGYSSLDTARQEAYALSLDMNSTQDIKGVSNMSCVTSAMNNGCLHEYNLSTVMADKKLVNTKKEKDCYTFTFKKMNNFKSVKSSDTYSSFTRPYSREGESIVNINIVNANTSVRAKMDNKEIWIHKNDNFEVIGPKDVTFEVIDQRFEYKKFTIKVSKEPKIITKNISLVQIKRKMKKQVEVGAGFERQDYKTGDTADDERIIVLKNRHQFDPNNSDVVNVHSGVEFTLKYKHYSYTYPYSPYDVREGLAIWPTDNLKDHDDYFVDCIPVKQHNTKSISKKMTMDIVAYGENFKKLASFKITYKIFTRGNKICRRYDWANVDDKRRAKYFGGEKYGAAAILKKPSYYQGGESVLYDDADNYVLDMSGDVITKIDVSIH